MQRDAGRSVTSFFSIVLLAALLVAPAAASSRPSLPPGASPPAETADLGSALAADGTFLGSDAVRGTVDASAWNLVSDLAAGEPPRFEPASDVVAPRAGREVDAFAGNVVSPDGVEWLALGSSGAGDGAISGQVRALALDGESLYIGGSFTNVSGIPEADFVARWNGSSWSALGSNGAGVGALNAFVNALDVFGGTVFVGGNFTDAAGIPTADYIARWNGSTWSAFGGTGNGALNSTVNALVVLSGQVYAGGFFTDAGGSATADYVARWTGSVWTALGSNGAGTNGALNAFVYALAISGSDVYVGGTFTDAAGIAGADRVARWSVSGSAWSALGSNQAGTNGALNDFVVALATSGGDVIVGGGFTNAADIATADYVARWNGSAWSALGSNGAGDGALNGDVRGLAVSDTTVYVGGFFTNAAGIGAADYVARWNGSAWSAIGSNGAGIGVLNDGAYALAASGSALYVGGAFANAAGVPQADSLALALVPGPWSAMGSNGAGDGPFGGPGGPGVPGVFAVAVSGNDVYVGGHFTNAGGIPAADFIARWDGTAWSALASGGAAGGELNGRVLALAVSGSDVFVGGSFTNAAGIATADYVARWNGTVWSALGSNPAGTNGALSYSNAALAGVGALAVSGSNLFVGGIFTNAAGIATADFVARWSGTVWSALGSNAPGTDGALNSTVRALAVSGTSLFVGGDFFNAGGIPAADRIASWSGSAWSALGSNGSGDGALNNPVGALAVSGGDLMVGGGFQNAAGNASADFVARWDGSTWSALGSNGAGNGALNNGVVGLAVSGGDLYVVGAFQNAGGFGPADFVARWNGSSWSTLGSNGAGDGALTEVVYAVAVSGSKLLLGGEFRNAHGIPAADYVAAYGPIATGPIATRKPDGRIRKGSGAFVGNNVYNSTGLNQTKTGAKARGSTITFGISIQNDGTAADRFKVQATGSATTMYGVRYFRGTTEITAAVVAGTYQTPSLAVGGTYLIKAKVKVKSTATIGSSVTRLVTIRSVADPIRLDAVKFIGKRG